MAREGLTKRQQEFARRVALGEPIAHACAALNVHRSTGHAWMLRDDVKAEIARLRPGAKQDERVAAIYSKGVEVAAAQVEQASQCGDPVQALQALQAAIAGLRLARDASAMGATAAPSVDERATVAVADSEKRVRRLLARLAKGSANGAAKE